MLTNQQAAYLLNLDKVLKDPGYKMDLREKKNRLELISPYDREVGFWVEITYNQRIDLKASIHHLETSSYTGLLRIDFKGTHENPNDIFETLPQELIPYTGKYFTPEEPHMHIYVEGYKPLAWAIPLAESDFPVKELREPADISNLIFKFAERINLRSKFPIQQVIS